MAENIKKQILNLTKQTDIIDNDFNSDKEELIKEYNQKVRELEEIKILKIKHLIENSDFPVISNKDILELLTKCDVKKYKIRIRDTVKLNVFEKRKSKYNKIYKNLEVYEEETNKKIKLCSVCYIDKSKGSGTKIQQELENINWFIPYFIKKNNLPAVSETPFDLKGAELDNDCMYNGIEFTNSADKIINLIDKHINKLYKQQIKTQQEDIEIE